VIWRLRSRRTTRCGTLDALHVATYLLARRRLGEVDLLTADRRVADAAGVPFDEGRES
jgi:hypothetical protein